MRDLLTDLKNIPKNAAIRKVNELVKRVRLAKAHMCIVGHLKKEMPAVFGKEKTQAKLLGSLEDHFLKVHRTHRPRTHTRDALLSLTSFARTSLGRRSQASSTRPHDARPGQHEDPSHVSRPAALSLQPPSIAAAAHVMAKLSHTLVAALSPCC